MMESDRRRSRVTIALGNTLAFSVDGGPPAAATARAELGERLGPKLDPELVEVAQLLLSELVTNCVVHGAATHPGAWIDISSSLFPQAIWIEVSDGGPTFRYRPRPAAPDGLSGRGLWLVEQLSSHWGISDREPASVWFELARTARGETAGG